MCHDWLEKAFRTSFISAGFPKRLNRPFVLKYVKPLGFANQASQPPLQAPWGVPHEWTAFDLPSGLPVVM